MRDVPQLRELAPGSYFRTASIDDYCRAYAEGLSRLSPMAIVERIYELAAGRVPVIVCWERADRGDLFCHRSLVAIWLGEHTDLTVEELGYEGRGLVGGSHPLLPQQYRLPLA